MNKENTTLGTATITNFNFNPAYCQYRLPCGYCEKLGRDCPKGGYNPYGPYSPTITLTNTSNNNKVFYTDATTLGSIYTNNLDKEEK